MEGKQQAAEIFIPVVGTRNIPNIHKNSLDRNIRFVSMQYLNFNEGPRKEWDFDFNNRFTRPVSKDGKAHSQ
jgi:hypothetical protein